MAGKGTKKSTKRKSLMGFEPQVIELSMPNEATQSIASVQGIAYAKPKNEKPFEVKKRRNKKPKEKKEVALEQFDFSEAIDWAQVLSMKPAALSEEQIKKQLEEVRQHREARKKWLTENLKHRRSNNAGQRFYIDKPKKPKTNFFSAVYSPQVLNKYKKPKTQKKAEKPLDKVKPTDTVQVRPVVKEMGLLDLAMGNLMDMWGQSQSVNKQTSQIQPKPEPKRVEPQTRIEPAKAEQKTEPTRVEQKTEPQRQKPAIPDLKKVPLPQLTAAKQEQVVIEEPIPIKPISGQAVESEPKPSLRERIQESRKQDVLKMPVVIVTGEKFTMRERYANDPVALNAAIVPVVDNRTAVLNRLKDPNHSFNAQTVEVKPKMPKRLRYYPSVDLVRKEVVPPEVEFNPNYTKLEDGEQPPKANFFKTKRAQSAVGEWQNFVVDEDKPEFGSLHEELLQGLIEDIEKSESDLPINEPPKVEPIADLGKIIKDISNSDQELGKTLQLEKLIESLDSAMQQDSTDELKLNQLLGEDAQSDLNEQFSFMDELKGSKLDKLTEPDDLDAQLMALLNDLEDDGFVDEDGTGIDDNLEKIVHGMVEEAIDDVDHTYEHGYIDEDGTGIDDNLEKIVHGMVEEAIEDFSQTPLAIKIEGLKGSVEGKTVLDGIDFDIERGEIAAIFGQKGAGKTTLLRIIAGQATFDAGSVSVFSQDITKKATQRVLGAIIEPPQFMDAMSARENIKYYASLHFGVTEERLQEVAELVGLSENLSDRVKKFTPLMRFKLAVAQAILHKPKLLVLDEPTSLVEPQDICGLRDFLTMIADSEDITVLLSTSALCLVQLLCDSVVVLKDGKKDSQLFVADMNSHDIKRFELEVSDFRKAAKLLQKQLGLDVTIDKKRLVFDLPENALKTVTELLLNSEIRILQ